MYFNKSLTQISPFFAAGLIVGGRGDHDSGDRPAAKTGRPTAPNAAVVKPVGPNDDLGQCGD